MSGRLPIIVLGGSDRRSGPLPPGLPPDQVLDGHKGTSELPWGRCLTGELVERLRRSDRFDDPVVVGPSRLYEGRLDCRVVDVEGDLPATFARIRRFVFERLDPALPVAFCTCDILPQPDELRQLIDELYRPWQDSSFWCALVEALPEELRSSSWKPSYRLPLAAGQAPGRLYPGHFVIARPRALRLRLVSYLLWLAYRYRNLNLRQKRFRMLVRGVGRMAVEDLRNLFSLRPTLLTVSVPLIGLRAYARLRRGELTLPQLAEAVGRVFVLPEFRRAGGTPPVVFAVTRIASFARDIDTKAELAEAVPMRTTGRPP